MENQTTTERTVTNEVNPNSTVRRETVSQNSTADSNSFFTSKINQIIWFIVSLIILIIGARFVLLLLGARNTEFVSFIYSLGKVFIFPFVGIFTSPTFNGTSYFDTAAVIGIVVWLIIGAVLTYFIDIFDKKKV